MEKMVERGREIEEKRELSPPVLSSKHPVMGKIPGAV